MAEEYPGNSKRERREKHKEEKIVSSQVITKKKSIGQRLSESLMPEDRTDVGGYLVFDVLIPAMKDTLSDLVKGGIDMLLFGQSGYNRRRDDRYRDGGRIVNYTKYSRQVSANPEVRRSRDRYDIDNVILGTRGEAEDVLGRMNDILDEYDVVSVADLKELVGVQSEYVDNNYGWDSLRTASIVHTREGYLIRLPKSICLK